MSRLKSRITLINRLSYSGKKGCELIPHLLSVNRVIDKIDSDDKIQKVCEHSELKKSRINQLTGLSSIELDQVINDVIVDPQGTNFLIFKN
jgi:hypothetical protein